MTNGGGYEIVGETDDIGAYNDAGAGDSSGSRAKANSSDSPITFGGSSSTFAGTGIPRLGGTVPVVTVSVLFGAMLTALLTFRRKEDE